MAPRGGCFAVQREATGVDERRARWPEILHLIAISACFLVEDNGLAPWGVR